MHSLALFILSCQPLIKRETNGHAMAIHESTFAQHENKLLAHLVLIPGM